MTVYKLKENKLGLIVNPVAGIGGRVGLKGSDGIEIQNKALMLGATPESINRAVKTLETIQSMKCDVELITYPEEMGGKAAEKCGFKHSVIGSIRRGETTAEDTKKAARQMQQMNVNLILFAGGDGTARDIYDAVGGDVPVLGIPAGVKIQSAVFSTNPKTAGELAVLYLRGECPLKEAEVLDIDEDAVRRGVVSPKLYGYLLVPFEKRLVQSAKVPSGDGEAEAAEEIALRMAETIKADTENIYIIGPGTTTKAIASKMGIAKTLVGVDVVFMGKLIGVDVNESQILKLIEGRRAKIVVTPIGGQGFIFGRGNQQISPKVIKKVGRENIIVVATPGKLNSLKGKPFLVDTGDEDVDHMLKGHIRVVTGYKDEAIYRVNDAIHTIS